MTAKLFEGRVERLGVVQENSGDAGRSCYALLLEGQNEVLILDTQQAVGADDFANVIEIRKRIALTVPNDRIRLQVNGRYVVVYENATLAARLTQRAAA